MHTVLSLIGMVLSMLIIYKRERVADMIGEADWMQKVGGVYIVVAILGVLLFLWSVAELTGTAEILFSPIKYMIPGAMKPEQAPF
jgi:uncharacterized membrane protein